jgi:hypothetical protein
MFAVPALLNIGVSSVVLGAGVAWMVYLLFTRGRGTSAEDPERVR